MIVENGEGGAVDVAASGQMEEGWTVIIRRLFTKEDPWNIHKMLGCLVLVSYLYRLSQFGTTDMGFTLQPGMTLATVALHLSLNLSSFAFTIPKARVKSDGGRIWPEYRLHSLVFLCRSLACIVVNWLEQQQQQQQAMAEAFNNKNIISQQPNYKANLWIVLGTMVAGDIASYSVGKKYHSNSIRDLSAPIWVKYYFSLMQFYATSVHLFGFRRCSIYFYFVLVIQVTAFLLTLRRKNIVSHKLNVVLYGSLLACGLSIGIYKCLIYTSSTTTTTTTTFSSKMIVPCAISSVACTAALWRMGPSIWPGMEKWLPWIRNKYLIWTAMYYYLNNILRPVIILTTTVDDDHDDHEVPILSKTRIQLVALIQFAIVVLYGINKQLQVVHMKTA